MGDQTEDELKAIILSVWEHGHNSDYPSDLWDTGLWLNPEQALQSLLVWHKSKVARAVFEAEVTRLTDLARAVGFTQGLGKPDKYLEMRYEALKKKLNKESKAFKAQPLQKGKS